MSCEACEAKDRTIADLDRRLFDARSMIARAVISLVPHLPRDARELLRKELTADEVRSRAPNDPAIDQRAS